MDRTNVKEVLCGPMIPVITHYNRDLSLDLDAVRVNVRYLTDHGLRTGQGVLLAVGAGGDFPMLSVEERKAVSRAIVEAAGDQAPVVVGAQDTNPAVCIEIARFAEEIGAYGIQLGPPFYYRPSGDDVYRFYRSIHDATARIVIMVYNTWWHHYDLSMEDLERLTGLERIAALKWSTPAGAISYLKGVGQFADRWAVVDNQGLPIMTHLLGGTGFITHLATVWPEHEITLWARIKAGDYKAAQAEICRANWPWLEFRSKIAARTNGESPPVRAALELTGRPGGPCRPPTRDLTADERRELRDLLIRIGVPDVQYTDTPDI